MISHYFLCVHVKCPQEQSADEWLADYDSTISEPLRTQHQIKPVRSSKLFSPHIKVWMKQVEAAHRKRCIRNIVEVIKRQLT
jgi:hypothetical protein